VERVREEDNEERLSGIRLMRIPTAEEIKWMGAIEPVWNYDERYNNFWQSIGGYCILITTDEDLDKELNTIKMDIANDFFLM
jgi:hypothetical protein